MGFTNYGTGHLLTKDQAVDQLTEPDQCRRLDSPDYPVVPVEKDGTVSMLVTMPDRRGGEVGTPEGDYRCPARRRHHDR